MNTILCEYAIQFIALYCCTGDEYIGMKGAPYNQEGLVQFVIDSVYALAIALHTLLTEKCSVPFPNCTTPAIRSGEEVLKYIRNVSFRGISNTDLTQNHNNFKGT
jgi:hypothetical protein